MNNFKITNSEEENMEGKARTLVAEIMESSPSKAVKKLEELRLLKEEAHEISSKISESRKRPIPPNEKEALLKRKKELFQMFEAVKEIAKGYSEGPYYCFDFYQNYLLAEILKIFEIGPENDLWGGMKFLLSISFPETVSLKERLLLVKDVSGSVEISRRRSSKKSENEESSYTKNNPRYNRRIRKHNFNGEIR